MTKAYSDPSYYTNKVITMGAGVSLGQTAGTTLTVARITLMENVTVTDANIAIRTGATAAVGATTIGWSLAGTGAVTAIGTFAIGTNADFTVVDTTVTSTNLSAGDDIVVQKVAGTHAGHVLEGVHVLLREHFVSD